MVARLLFGLLAQLAGEIGEPVQCGIDADQGEIGLDDLQVKVPDVRRSRCETCPVLGSKFTNRSTEIRTVT